MKIGPLMPKKDKKEKKEKPTVDQKIMEAGVRLRALQKKYRVVIERELRAIRYSRGQKRDNPKAVTNLKNAYYALTVVNRAQDRLREISSLQELAKAMNEMSSVLKLLNGIEGKTDKVNTRALNSGMKKLDKNAARSEGGMSNYYGKPLDDLVDDQVIERLLKGESLDMCLRDEEAMGLELGDAIPVSEELLQYMDGETDDLEAAMLQIDELTRDL